MTQGYSAFANGGQKVEPQFIEKVVAPDGELLYQSEPALEEALDPKLSFILTDLMTGMFDSRLNAHTSVTGGSIAQLVTRPVAGKSGSTSTDSWMIGYTPQLVTSVWVGYDSDHTLNHSTEGQVAKKIWGKFTEDALSGQLKLPFKQPQGVVGVAINPENGLLATDSCPTDRMTYFVVGTEPTSHCPEHESEEEDMIEEETHEKERFLDRFF